MSQTDAFDSGGYWELKSKLYLIGTGILEVARMTLAVLKMPKRNRIESGMETEIHSVAINEFPKRKIARFFVIFFCLQNNIK